MWYIKKGSLEGAREPETRGDSISFSVFRFHYHIRAIVPSQVLTFPFFTLFNHLVVTAFDSV